MLYKVFRKHAAKQTRTILDSTVKSKSMNVEQRFLVRVYRFRDKSISKTLDSFYSVYFQNRSSRVLVQNEIYRFRRVSRNHAILSYHRRNVNRILAKWNVSSCQLSKVQRARTFRGEMADRDRRAPRTRKLARVVDGFARATRYVTLEKKER